MPQRLRFLLLPVLIVSLAGLLQGQEADQAEAKEAELEDLFGEVAMEFVQDDPQMQLISQYIQTECGLVRRACNLSDEQIAGLEQMNTTWVRDELKKPAKANAPGVLKGIGRFLGGQVMGQVVEQNAMADVTRLRAAVDRKLSEALNEEQMASYNSEKDARLAFRDEAMAGVLLSSLDSQIYLKKDQRRELIPDVAKWVSGKSLYWQFYFQNESYIPAIPDNILRKVLDGKQVQSLQGLNSYVYEMDEINLVNMNMGGQGQVAFVEVSAVEAGKDTGGDVTGEAGPRDTAIGEGKQD